LDTELLEAVARVAVDKVATKRSTFSHANVLAEVHRQLHGVHFATAFDRLDVADRINNAALCMTVQLTRPTRAGVGAAIYTIHEVLDAETRLLDAGRNMDAPMSMADVFAAQTNDTDHALGADQAVAVKAIARSRRTLDVLVGPAGTGKTTSLAALRHAWETEHGKGSVTGLAPSAVAAEVLADELQIDTENTAKWLHEANRQDDRLDRIATLIDRIDIETSSPSTAHARDLYAQLGQVHADYERWMIKPNQLVIVDEAGLAGTLTLDRLVAEAHDAGAKVLLVGDWAQLGAIDAGGAFAMLVNDRTDAPELTNVRRFQNEWERDASLHLRVGDPEAIDAYTAHDRVRSGDRGQMLDQLYRAWNADVDRGIPTLMIAGDYESVAELNLRARADRIATGKVDTASVEIAGGCVAGVGDHIVTRQNDRRITAGHSWVKNGDTWIVDGIGRDGSLAVRRDSDEAKTILGAAYVQNHVELGYAATAYRAQGRTVDSTHSLITATSTRESLYVSTTRGRAANTIYVDTNDDPDPETTHEAGVPTTAPEILTLVLDRTTVDVSAHAVLYRERKMVQSLEDYESARQDAFNKSLAPTRVYPDPDRSVSLAAYQ
jgi:ATP-dependent exoDNAse (exonuclease V) alpha subunit